MQISANSSRFSVDSLPDDIFLSDDAFNDYKRILKEYSASNKEDNQILIDRLRKGDITARQELIERNLGLAISVAVGIKRDYISHQLNDLVQEGTIGLIEAVDKIYDSYDESLGAFSTYAVYWIKQRICRSLDIKDKEIKRPLRFSEKKRSYLDMENRYRSLGVPMPDDDTVCAILNMTTKCLRLIRLDDMYDTVSLSTPIDEKYETELQDTVPLFNDEYKKFENELKDRTILVFLKNTLSPLDYFILYYRFLGEKRLTQIETANLVGLTHQRIKQKEDIILKSLRNYIKDFSFNIKVPLKTRRLLERGLLNLEPINPEYIARYFFVRDRLSPVEKELYKERFFSDYTYDLTTIAQKWNIDEKSLSAIDTSLKQKLNRVFKDEKPLYEAFKELLVARFKSGIFGVNLEMDISGFLDAARFIAECEKIQGFKGTVEFKLNAIAKGYNISMVEDNSYRELASDEISNPLEYTNVSEEQTRYTVFEPISRDDGVTQELIDPETIFNRLKSAPNYRSLKDFKKAMVDTILENNRSSFSSLERDYLYARFVSDFVETPDKRFTAKPLKRPTK